MNTRSIVTRYYHLCRYISHLDRSRLLVRLPSYIVFIVDKLRTDAIVEWHLIVAILDELGIDFERLDLQFHETDSYAAPWVWATHYWLSDGTERAVMRQIELTNDIQ